MKSSCFVNLHFTSFNLVLCGLCVVILINSSFTRSLYAKEIVTIDRGSQDAYHLEVMHDLNSSEQTFLSIINDEDSSRTEKLEAKTRLGSLYLLNKEFRQAIHYLQEVDATSDFYPEKNKFVSSARYNFRPPDLRD